jgi:hypothetical protein
LDLWSLYYEQMRPTVKISTAILLAGATCLAFWLHVYPAWNVVFTPDDINFQEPDAWFHMRAIHNLVANFPWRSGFDPYAFYPGGAKAATDAWDYLAGSVACLAGWGAPSDALVDEVGSWLPALLGPPHARFASPGLHYRDDMIAHRRIARNDIGSPSIRFRMGSARLGGS